MSIEAVLFDLDGTLLPMDQEVFVKTYFGLLAKKLAPYGYEPMELIDAVWAGTKEMVRNCGPDTNERVFWQSFCGRFGEKAIEHEPIFQDFYANEFGQVRSVCGFTPLAAEAVKRAKAKGLRTILATNPIFPKIATKSRMGWAGLSPDDFELCTTYENCTSCKPNLDYYRNILERMGLPPEKCLMVGNDVQEDMIAAELGMSVFLLGDCMIDKSGGNGEGYSSGGFERLIEVLKEL